MEALTPVVNLSCKDKFVVSHYLNSSLLSSAANKIAYGICNNWDRHEHEYGIEVITRGKINSEIGTIISLSELKDILRRAVINRLHGKDLDRDVDYFKTIPSTMENVAVFVWKQLKQEMFSPELLHEVKIIDETDNCVIYSGHCGFSPKRGQTLITSDTD